MKNSQRELSMVEAHIPPTSWAKPGTFMSTIRVTEEEVK
jgi:hypothetical protein